MSTTAATTTPAGTFNGTLLDNGQSVYRGIKFATAQRWQHPVDIESYTSPVDASEPGFISPQVPGFLEQMLGTDASSMSEDCLHLNIYCPQGASVESNLPVLFWIHGGAYTNGAGSIAWYDGSRLASKGTVVVSINYRLGPLGFAGSENYGVLDMLSGLRWVNRNIASFGGNPNNVTIFGESAGGSAVVSLMATDATNRLFHKAWSMSPSIGQLRDLPRANELLDEFLGLLDEDSLAAAAHKTVDEVLEAGTKAATSPSKGFDIFAPTAGGTAVKADLLATAARCPIPFVVGTNKDENKLWSAFDQDAASAGQREWEKFTQQQFGDTANTARAVYERYRPNEAARELISAVNTDTSFRQRAQELSEQRCVENTPTWMYWFTWETPAFGGILGSCHAIDIPFAFDNLDAPGAAMLLGEGAERQAISDRFASEIVHFATHGHPTWQQFNVETRPTLEIGENTDLINDPEAEIRQLFGRK
jgi:para-nitrobenzyl esterase